ncbi:MAG: hypothetical protein COA78_14505 [Blastopirellula sp.]|nr:MAG: hypothetical protein COA78_14505 [Blastopirellula sp.]
MADSTDAPPKVAPKITARPKVRQLYWCRFPSDAELPEFWKTRPVVVISHNNTLHGAVTVVACSTQSQPSNKWAFQVENSIDGEKAWAICDKPTTVAVSRLTPDKEGIKRISDEEFNGILTLMLKWIPSPR